MKRITSLIICVIMLTGCIVPASANTPKATLTETLSYSETILDDGTVVTDELIVESYARATQKTATRTRTFTRDDVVIGVVAFQAAFRYDGTTVSVVSKTVTQSDTYDGWSYIQETFVSSGGTVTLDGRLTKWLGIFRVDFTMTMTCDKDGNISGT